ncbi:MAG: hypothetical protein JNL11_03640 [Bdellovibrionaceae bacterium]|nr:hypothetical protein [Pseudobdellovibrionaceae bacterium]
MIINLFVITGILLQLEKDFNDRPDYNVDRLIMQTSDTDGEVMKSLKEKTARKTPYEYNQ